MRPAVHLDPERLRVHAAAAGELSEALRAVVSAGASPGGLPPAQAAELERLESVVRRALRELAELSAVLVATAASAVAADTSAAEALQHVADRA